MGKNNILWDVDDFRTFCFVQNLDIWIELCFQGIKWAIHQTSTNTYCCNTDKKNEEIPTVGEIQVLIWYFYIRGDHRLMVFQICKEFPTSSGNWNGFARWRNTNIWQIFTSFSVLIFLWINPKAGKCWRSSLQKNLLPIIFGPGVRMGRRAVGKSLCRLSLRNRQVSEVDTGRDNC